ncbi:MAG TPA: hypothetical protein VMT42_05840 [candidate division Zixibacteria bacterium]|nr:hypothetical protein [candidate division Zixibacteria bacterium]
MTERKKDEMVAELNKQVSALKDQENTLGSEARKFAEKRDELNGRMRSLRDEVLELRSQRDELNIKVKELKQRRDEMRVGIHGKLEEIKKLVEEQKVLAKRRPSQSHGVLQKEVESIDWTIQTTSLTLQEDRELVEKVKQLETQLSIHRKLEQLAKRIAQLRTEARSMKAETEHLHRQLTENAQKSQETHRKMLEKIEESKTLKAEADSLHKQFLQAKERTRPLQQEMKAVLNRIRQLKGEIREEAQKERKESEDTLRETLETRAKEKLKRGEKLTWEEFQLLAEKGITEQG